MTPHPDTKAPAPGTVIHHSTDEDGIPDVAYEVALAAGDSLWIGEISRQTWQDHGGEDLECGDDSGWWIVRYQGRKTHILGKTSDWTTAAALAELVAGFVTAAQRTAMSEAMAAGGWRDMASAPRDGTHILALLRREACEDMDREGWPAFSEVREIWFHPFRCPIFDEEMPWHAGDPFGDRDGLSDTHYGEDVPVAWMSLPPPPAEGK